MQIRHATTDDAALLSRFVCELASTHIAPTLGDGGTEVLLRSMGEDSTKERILDGWPHLIATDEHHIAGIAVIKPPAHVYHLFVRTDTQRQGVGRFLLDAAREIMTRDNPGRIITVNSSLNAIEVYRRFGFEKIGDIVDEEGVRYQPMAMPTTN